MLSTLSFLKATCAISRKTQAVSSTNYEQGVTWSDGTVTPCAIQAVRGFEQTQAAREAGTLEFDVYFPTGTDVRTGDKLSSFAGCALASTDVLEVTSPATDDGGELAYVRVTATLVKGRDVR